MDMGTNRKTAKTGRTVKTAGRASAKSSIELEHLEELQETKQVGEIASLTLIAGFGTLLGLPFALRAGAEFFLPVTAALVIAIALVPLLEWFERRGIPAKLAAALCVLIFLATAIFAVAAIVIPAIDWVSLVPERIDNVTMTLQPVLDLYANLERFVDNIASRIASSGASGREVRIETPNSMLGIITASAPHALIQLFFALLVIFFFLAGWTGMRRRTITQPRQLRRCDDHRSSHPGRGRRDIDLSSGRSPSSTSRWVVVTAFILWLLGMPIHR